MAAKRKPKKKAPPPPQVPIQVSLSVRDALVYFDSGIMPEGTIDAVAHGLDSLKPAERERMERLYAEWRLASIRHNPKGWGPADEAPFPAPAMEQAELVLE